MNKPHQKHAKLNRPSGGTWGRTELALMGAPCGVIRDFAEKLTIHFADKWNLGFVDAEHNPSLKTEFADANIHFNSCGNFVKLDLAAPIDPYNQRRIFNACDLVLVNGNHAQAKQQIVIIHPEKSLEKKLDKLTDVQLVLLAGDALAIPDYLQSIIGNAPQLSLSDESGIYHFFQTLLETRKPGLNGLVLIGGKSERMGTDKSLLSYHGNSQREYVMQLLQPLCEEAFLSCNARQSAEIELPKIEDRFLGIGPMSGILSAFQTAPDKAWLTVACDMPYLNSEILDYLIVHRNPSKLATAFSNSDEELPEPLLTIWEPKAYPVLLQALSMGISCPRKVLIHSDIELIRAPSPDTLKNINDPQAKQDVFAQLDREKEKKQAT